MRTVLSLVVLGALAGPGCASRKGAVPLTWEDPSTLVATVPANTTVETSQTATTPPVSRTAAVTPSNQKLIVTPENALVGKVATVNQTAGFVVLSFPVGQMPAIDQRLSLYRRGLKVGEVKITGPQIDENVVADIVAGDSDVGDEVK